MNSNSITREQAEERLKSSNMKALRAEVLDMLFPAPNPPPFRPTEGEVIAVRNGLYRKFIKMVDDGYYCEISGSCGRGHVWSTARPLTDKERRL